MDTTSYTSATGFFVLPRMSFRNKRDKLLFYDFVDRANYRDNGEIKRGQFPTSVAQLVEETGWKEKMIRGSLDNLKKQGRIQIQTFKDKKRGMIITIVNYNEFQSLDFYTKKGELKGDIKGELEGELEPPEKPVIPTDEGTSKEGEGELEGNIKGELKGDSLTTDITTDKQQDKHKKDLCEQIAKNEDVETFVDSQMRINPISTLPRKLFIEYFNTIRLTRKTGRIATSKAQKIWDKLYSYWQNPKIAKTPDGRAAIILYALTVHIMKHDDIQEDYTYGIIRRTTEHEARQKMLKMMNKSGGVNLGITSSLDSERAEYHKKRRTL
ncbi:hypothetical protein [Brevibacillus laterosporus]|uniref:Uncharacterized protein n=1 Tax=Brevibacillus laterosporus TaxID=1465 RepID=A0AAP3DJE5_BRELA|nr:hypothetical protein [Brevibacillus laterosporus]MCR8981612.1 hypothetical protein [Brevibacillus laterosporus]MCZ0808767.1 hypothetical protein [Brevibacillus laterosporus]MCZ0827260.1 hypothetical protein [Brevibacillus laterosporus]MCZ0851016.1 hypothetical protein [Brevibacillus laterosporus]